MSLKPSLFSRLIKQLPINPAARLLLSFLQFLIVLNLRMIIFAAKFLKDGIQAEKNILTRHKLHKNWSEEKCGDVWSMC